MQLLDGRDYTNWPLQRSTISQRYSGLPDVELTTFTAEGFVGAKTIAWCDSTRNAPRDLYDLWAPAEHGHITADAALLYQKHGNTGGFPRSTAFPQRPPTPADWLAAPGHQCQPLVGPEEAFETVITAWERAVEEASPGPRA